MPRPLTSKNSFTIIRAMDDDYYQVRSPQGQVHVVRLIQCVECDSWMQPSPTKVCRTCVGAERNRIRKASMEAGAKKRHIANLAISVRRRAAIMVLAAPKWRDRDKIKTIYEEAKRLTVETGVVHHVDHYYPLQGLLCCGLHVHHNLRVLPASENCSKSNGQPLEDSPATAAFIKQYGESGFRTWLKWAKEGIK